MLQLIAKLNRLLARVAPGLALDDFDAIAAAPSLLVLIRSEAFAEDLLEHDD